MCLRDSTGATLRVLDKDGNVVDEWVSEDTPHYMEAVLVAGETYTLEETLVPDNSGYVPANAIQFTVCLLYTSRCV